jgi:signal transduction histidine kinase
MPHTETLPAADRIAVVHERAAGRVNVAQCIAGVAALLRGALGHGVPLKIRVDHGLPAVMCDPFALQTAILNLISNARDAMPNGGMVSISAAEVVLGVHDFVELRVTDNGIGMTPDTIERAFDPFFTTKSDGLGGIGLQMVERFVRDTDGRIFIESQYGVGTTVILQLPASTQPISQETIP